MSPRLTPYDSGEILEPRVWVDPATHMIISDEAPRPARPEDWGKVEFENDESMPELVVRVRRDGRDLVLEVERLSDMDELRVVVEGEEFGPVAASSESSVPAAAESAHEGT